MVKCNVAIFATNLDRLMTLRSMRNAALAYEMGVSRQVISQWRLGNYAPTEDREELLGQVLQCDPCEFHRKDVVDMLPMLPIVQWAKREGIPIGRARKLFTLGILSGSTGGGIGQIQLVPIELHAPPDSKRLVREIRRPDWIDAFRVNLDWRMRADGISNYDVAGVTGVGYCSVMHWRSGVNYPDVERLPKIAEALKCSVNDLLQPPSRTQTVDWVYRYETSWQESSTAAA